MTERARLTDALALAAGPASANTRSTIPHWKASCSAISRTVRGLGCSVSAALEKGSGNALPLPASGPTLTKFAAEYVERRSPSWKPSTVTATMSYLNSAILPALGHLRVGAVVRADVARFFHEYGRRKPGGANRSHDILRNMFDCAISWGHRPEAAGNPCTGITRYRRPPRGRLLGADDLAKLGAGAAGQPRRRGIRGMGIPRRERGRTVDQACALQALDQDARRGRNRGGRAAA